MYCAYVLLLLSYGLQQLCLALFLYEIVLGGEPSIIYTWTKVLNQRLVIFDIYSISIA